MLGCGIGYNPLVAFTVLVANDDVSSPAYNSVSDVAGVRECGGWRVGTGLSHAILSIIGGFGW